MLNAEKYKKEILDITIKKGSYIALTKDGLCDCAEVFTCRRCMFDDMFYNCKQMMIKWLLTEATEDNQIDESRVEASRQLGFLNRR